MKKDFETKTIVVNSTKRKKSAVKHLKWALPLSVGFVAGIVPLSLGIYALANPKPTSELKIVKNLSEFNDEIAEEFIVHGDTFIPNFDFIKFLNVGEVPTNQPLYNHLHSNYPNLENTIVPGTFKFIVTRHDGTKYWISETESSNPAIFNHGYSYSLYDLFNVDIKNYLVSVANNFPTTSNTEIDNVPTPPDWSTYELRLKDYSTVVPHVLMPEVLPDTATDDERVTYQQQMDDYVADQERMRIEREVIDLENQHVMVEYKVAYDIYNVNFQAWMNTLNENSLTYIDTISKQFENIMNSMDSPFNSDRHMYGNMVYSDNALFNTDTATQTVSEIYNQEMGITSPTDDIRYIKVANFIEKYFSAIITKDEFLTNTSVTLGEIPYFIGTEAGTSVSFEYEIATRKSDGSISENGVGLIPVESTDEQRLNTYWLRNENEMKYDAFTINELKHSLGGE